MTFPDLTPELSARMPDLRGRLIANQPLAELTWFRVGGPAQVLFTPADEDDLAAFLAHLPAEIPVTVIGLGSNLIVRDGGVPGVVVRLGKAFAWTCVIDDKGDGAETQPTIRRNFHVNMSHVKRAPFPPPAR